MDVELHFLREPYALRVLARNKDMTGVTIVAEP